MRNILECCVAAAPAPVDGMGTPANTTGMGDVSPEDEPMAIALPSPMKHRKRKHKMIVPIKQYIKQKINS